MELGLFKCMLMYDDVFLCHIVSNLGNRFRVLSGTQWQVVGIWVKVVQ